MADDPNRSHSGNSPSPTAHPLPVEIETAQEAQKRIDRIHAFQAELKSLEAGGALTLDAAQRESVARFHSGLLDKLSAAFEVDRNDSQKQLSLGMRITAFLGALALGASLFFFFYRIWGLISTPVQVAVLAGLPVAGLIGAEVASRREKTGYFTGLAALLAYTAFVINLSALGKIFNIVSSPNAFLAWAGFAFILAYGYGLRLLLVSGILSLLGFLSAEIGTFGGCYWIDFERRPENFLVAGFLIAALSFLAPPRRFPGFAAFYRLFGMLASLIAILILSNWGDGSYFRADPRYLEWSYQIFGFTLSALLIWAGIRRRWRETINLGSVFFALFLYTKFYDWWWEYMPKYLFFLVVGLTAVGLLLFFKRLRGTSMDGAA